MKFERCQTLNIAKPKIFRPSCHHRLHSPSMSHWCDTGLTCCPLIIALLDNYLHRKNRKTNANSYWSNRFSMHEIRGHALKKQNKIESGISGCKITTQKVSLFPIDHHSYRQTYAWGHEIRGAWRHFFLYIPFS